MSTIVRAPRNLDIEKLVSTMSKDGWVDLHPSEYWDLCDALADYIKDAAVIGLDSTDED